jgi:hypothetical protein
MSSDPSGRSGTGCRWKCAGLAALLLLAPACSKPPQGDSGSQRAAPVNTDIARIVFSLPGDDIGTAESTAVLAKIKAAIAGGNVGEVVSSGFGMGSMSLVVKLRGDGSLNAVREIIRATYPEAKYRIEREGP